MAKPPAHHDSTNAVTIPDFKLTPLNDAPASPWQGLFACRMLGAVPACCPCLPWPRRGLPGGDRPRPRRPGDGIYGLTQAFMQIPSAWRRTAGAAGPCVLWDWLLFVAGSVMCALVPERVLDHRRPRHAGRRRDFRRRLRPGWPTPPATQCAPAPWPMVGASIGVSFAVSLVAAPLLVGWWGIAGTVLDHHLPGRDQLRRGALVRAGGTAERQPHHAGRPAVARCCCTAICCG